MYIERLQDAWADKWGTFPTTPDGPLQHDEVQAVFLIAMADGMRSGEPCEVEDCEACNAIHAAWWAELGTLDRRVRIRMQAVMRVLDIPLPSGPREIVGQDALPASRN